MSIENVRAGCRIGKRLLGVSSPAWWPARFPLYQWRFFGWICLRASDHLATLQRQATTGGPLRRSGGCQLLALLKDGNRAGQGAVDAYELPSRQGRSVQMP